VDEAPEQIAVGLAAALVGATGGVFIVTVVLAHVVVPQSASNRT